MSRLSIPGPWPPCSALSILSDGVSYREHWVIWGASPATCAAPLHSSELCQAWKCYQGHTYYCTSAKVFYKAILNQVIYLIVKQTFSYIPFSSLTQTHLHSWPPRSGRCSMSAGKKQEDHNSRNRSEMPQVTSDFSFMPEHSEHNNTGKQSKAKSASAWTTQRSPPNVLCSCHKNQAPDENQIFACTSNT